SRRHLFQREHTRRSRPCPRDRGAPRRPVMAGTTARTVLAALVAARESACTTVPALLVATLASACAAAPRTATPGPAPLAALSLREFARFVDTMVTAPRFRNAHWGVLIVDPAAGDTLYSRNAGKLFMPASNQKLLTGATALAQLGSSYRFTTRFAATGPVDSAVHGDLVVIGAGDPTFSDTLRDGDFRNAFRAMTDSLAARGVRRVTGALVRGGAAFTDGPCGYGWELDDLDEPYGACVAELFVNEGYQRVRRV